MITVSIFINGNPVITRSAVREPKKDKEIDEVLNSKEPYKYVCDEGSIIDHLPKDGIIALAKKMLDTAKVEEMRFPNQQDKK